MSSKRPVRVLLVDDEPRVLDSMSALLSTYPDIEVAGVATTGAESLTVASACRPDVVVMDAIMPEMDGIEATRRLKAEPAAPRVLLLTTYGAVERDARAAGADEVLMKVDSDEEIVDAIRRHGRRR